MASTVMNGALSSTHVQTRTAFKTTTPRTVAPRSACLRVQAQAQDRSPLQAGASALVASAAAVILALPGASVAATPAFTLADVTGTEQSSRTSMGPNEVDVKDLSSLPNASEKDAAAPAMQKYAEPPKPQAAKAVPEAVKQGVESVNDKNISAAPGREAFTIADVTGTEQSSRTSMGPNEVDVKDLSSLPNASEKDAAAPAMQKYAEPPKPQAAKAVPEAVKQGVESVNDKNISAAPGREAFTIADVTGTEQSSRTRLGPNEVDVKDLQSLPNASKKDSAVPNIQKYAEPPKKKQAGKPVPEAVKQGVETPQDKGGKKKKGAEGGESGGGVTAGKAKSNPQFEAFIRRIRGGK